MALTPDGIQNFGEIAGAIILACGTAIGGYIAKGKFKRPAKNSDTSTVPVCEKHESVMVALSTAIAKLTDLHDDVKETNAKLAHFIDYKWEGILMVVRKHERAIGQLQGKLGIIRDDDTKHISTIGKESPV